MRLSEAVEALCIATKANGRASRTVESYREKLAPMVSYLGDQEIEATGAQDLRRYVADLYDQDLSPFTVSSRVRAVKRLWNFCEEEGLTEANPARRIKMPTPRREAPKGVRESDVRALIRETGGDQIIDLRDQAIVLLLLDTGCRVGGLVGLRLKDVDLKRRRATVSEKGGKTRVVFFLEPTGKALASWLRVRPHCETESVFVTLGNEPGRALQYAGVARMLARRGKRAGCRGPVNPHAFRHGFARSYLTNGGDLATLADLMGHSDVHVTKAFYGVFTADELQRQHQRYSPVSELTGDSAA